MQEQLDRIEKKLDRALERNAKNSADIAWLKRIVGGVGLLLGGAVLHLLRKIGFGA